MELYVYVRITIHNIVLAIFDLQAFDGQSSCCCYALSLPWLLSWSLKSLPSTIFMLLVENLNFKITASLTQASHIV
jgi:hypothetical protein